VLALKQGTDQFQTSQTKTNEEQTKKSDAADQTNKDRDASSKGFEEQLGAMVQTCADLTGKVETMAKKEEVTQLKARVEGGFNAIVVHMEAERWVKSNCDTVADGISQSFLGLVDQTCEKLALRVSKVESALSDTGA